MNAELGKMGLVLGVALVAALALTPLTEWAGHRLGLVDRPRPGETQRRPMARTGGYAVFAAFLIALGASLLILPRSAAEQQRLLGLLAGCVLILPLAVADDFRRLGPLPQFAGQFVVAIVAILFGLLIDNVANPFGGIVYFPLAIAVPLTFIWIVGMMNTINLIDSTDGLATGVCLIAAIALFVRSFDLGQYSIAVLPVALVGACLGFLPFNFNPARAILGSSGALFLGFALAVLAIIGGAKIATAVMVLGLPILDVTLVVVQRTLRGRSPFKGGDGLHLQHRLVAAGLSVRRVALLAYVFCALAGWLALSLSGEQKLYVFLVVGLAVLLLAVVLGLRSRGTASSRQAGGA